MSLLYGASDIHKLVFRLNQHWIDANNHVSNELLCEQTYKKGKFHNRAGWKYNKKCSHDLNINKNSIISKCRYFFALMSPTVKLWRCERWFHWAKIIFSHWFSRKIVVLQTVHRSTFRYGIEVKLDGGKCESQGTAIDSLIWKYFLQTSY